MAVLLIASAGASAAERPVRWHLNETGIPPRSSTKVEIEFPVEFCQGGQGRPRVEVSEAAEAVTISVFETPPVAPAGTSCEGLQAIVEQTVQLGSRLGGRAIIDGATSTPIVTAERPASFSLVRRHKPRPDTRRVRIAIQSGVCDPDDSPDQLFTRVVVRRTRKSITVRAYARTDPYPYGIVCFGVGKPIMRTVSLKGRLGKRVLRDGSFTPPRAVVR
jgi:hypothetical protein